MNSNDLRIIIYKNDIDVSTQGVYNQGTKVANLFFVFFVPLVLTFKTKFLN